LSYIATVWRTVLRKVAEVVITRVAERSKPEGKPLRLMRLA